LLLAKFISSFANRLRLLGGMRIPIGLSSDANIVFTPSLQLKDIGITPYDNASVRQSGHPSKFEVRQIIEAFR
jgi:hypothetical protein